MSEYSRRVVKARKPHRCDARAGYPYPCRGIIQPGTSYVRTVAFPGDVNTSTVPWVMKICDNCAAGYPDIRDLIEIEIAPARKEDA